MMLHFHNAMIGDSHLENIGSQILQTGMAFTHCLAVDVPLTCPDLGRDKIEEPGFYHLLPEFGSEDPGEGSYRKIEIDS
jgi:hypothetical protein